MLQLEGNTEFSLQLERTSVHCYNLRGPPSFPPQLKRTPCKGKDPLKKRPNSTAPTREEPKVPPHNSRGGLTPLLQLKVNPNIPMAT